MSDEPQTVELLPLVPLKNGRVHADDADRNDDAREEDPDDGAAADAQEFEALLAYLKVSRSFDFTGYKRASLMRRVWKRMQMVGITDWGSYVDYLEVHADEFRSLFNLILINVTAFFRDPPMWDFLVQEVIPRIVAGKSEDEPIRIWSAGCASGEEVYTLAIVFAEALGLEQFGARVKIYATDIDDEALAEARQASYSAHDVAGVPPALLEKHFEHMGDRYILKKDLRRAVIFGRHDLLQDAPISRIDLLTCRNTLMYFNAEVQGKIMARLHFALRDDGFLFLGKAEMLFTHAALFIPLELKRRIFTKLPLDNLRDHRRLLGRADASEGTAQMTGQVRLREVVFDTGPVAQIVIDVNGLLAVANARARALFRLSQHDLGRPLQDMEISYRPVELRSLIKEAYAERRPVLVKSISWLRGGEVCYLDAQVVPLLDTLGTLLGAAVAFTDVTRYVRLQEELQESSREVETAYEELQSTNEELETTNEELQSAVEELETTNEELQSTNEELETMNAELQSTNEELQTVNDEAQQRSGDLNEVNAFLNSVLASLRGVFIVLNRSLQVQVWKGKSEEMWGLRGDEVQEMHFLNLDIGLPVERLAPLLRAGLAGEAELQEMTLDAVNRRGKAFACHITCIPLRSASHEVAGVILLMEERS